MKTIAILMIAVLAFALVAPIVAAEETELELVDAGITPDSPLHGLDRAIERVRLAFAFGKVNKARLRLQYAEERLAEAEQMADEGNEEALVEAQEAHDEELEEVEDLVEKLESDSEEEVAQEALENVQELQLGLLNHSERITFVHNRILERLRQNENVSNETLAHLEEVFSKIQNKSQEVEQRIAQRRENIRTKYKVLSNKTEEELDETEVDFLERVEEARERNKERIQERIEIRQEVKDKVSEQIRERIQDRFGEVEDEIETELENETESEEEFEEQGNQAQVGQE